jgi:hypothetical protein
VEARRELLPIVDDADLGDTTLRQLVESLRRAPDAEPATHMTDLADDARNLLATLLIEERRGEDVVAAIGQFRAHLSRLRSLKEMREDGRRIAEAQARTGVDAPVSEAYRSLYERGRRVHDIARGVASSLDHGTSGPPRSPEA